MGSNSCVRNPDTLRYDSVQLEGGSFSTIYTAYTAKMSTNTKLLYNLSIDKNSGTMTSWFNTKAPYGVRNVFSNEGSSNQGISAYIGTDNHLKLAVKNSAGNLVDLISTNETIQPNTWHFAGLKWQMVGGTLNCNLYLDDRVYSSNTADYKDFTGATTAVGSIY